MADLTLREPSERDAAAIAAICNAVSRELYGIGDADENEVRSWFALPDLKAWVLERDGRVVAYADTRRDDDGTRFPIDIRVASEARGSGAAARLVAAAEDWACGRANGGALLRGFVAERDRQTAAELEHAGYRLIRHSFHMQIELLEHVESPSWPEGISVRRYRPERDEQGVYECHQDSFADHWDFHRVPKELWRTFMLRDERFDPDLWWLAEADGELAAVCLNAWHFSGEPGFGWVGVLGVRPAWRRRGLGLALLQNSFADFKERGATKVGLGVDAENTTGAVRLYERAGMRPVRRNDTYEKPVAAA